MDLYDLPFAKIIILRDDIAEVMINEGVELDIDMVNQYHQFLLSHLQAPFSLLINKVNAYTYDFHAQERLATLKEINAMAVVAYNRITRLTTETLASFPREVEWNLKIFSSVISVIIFRYRMISVSRIQLDADNAPFMIRF